MLFRQMIERESSSYTYLLGCRATGEALLIDPVIETIDRDLAMIEGLGLRLVSTAETHVHADHLTASWELRRRTGCRVVYPAAELVPCADVQLADNQSLSAGTLTLRALHTPGHTAGAASYLLADHAPPILFSGDALLIDGCGRTDLPGGDAATLYASVRARLFTLSEETLVYPGHDYHQRRVSTVGQERARNPRLGDGKTLDEFIAIMSNLNLPFPNKIKTAVPANRCCGGDAACKSLTGKGLRDLNGL